MWAHQVLRASLAKHHPTPFACRWHWFHLICSQNLLVMDISFSPCWHGWHAEEGICQLSCGLVAVLASPCRCTSRLRCEIQCWKQMAEIAGLLCLSSCFQQDDMKWLRIFQAKRGHLLKTYNPIGYTRKPEHLESTLKSWGQLRTAVLSASIGYGSSCGHGWLWS